MDRNPIVGATVVMAWLLSDAEAAGLPMPYDVSATEYAPWGHPAWDGAHYGRTGGIRLQVHPEDHAAWAVYLEATEANPTPDIDTHLRADATVDGIPVRVTAIFPAEDAAEAEAVRS